MKHQILLVLLFALGLTNCTKENTQLEGLDSQWTLVSYSNIVGQVHCTYDKGDIIWNVEEGNLKIDGRLITPWEFTPCYTVDSKDYKEIFIFTVDKSGDEDILIVDELGLEAKITIDDNLVLEVISSTDFTPPSEGIKVFFEKF